MIGILFHMLNGLFSSLGAIKQLAAVQQWRRRPLLFMVAAGGMLWVERRQAALSIAGAAGSGEDDPRVGDAVVQELTVAVE